MRCSSQPFLSATKPNLQAQDISHGLGGFFLRRGGDMGIGVQGEASGEVTQHAGHRLDVHTVLQGNGGEGVPLRYNYDKPEMPRISKGFWDCQACFSSFSKPKNRAAK